MSNDPTTGEQATNGEIVPDDGDTAESLRHDAEEHPASDGDAGHEHTQSRKAGDVAGLTRNGPSGDDSFRDEQPT